jgi:hypothetical protein
VQLVADTELLAQAVDAARARRHRGGAVGQLGLGGNLEAVGAQELEEGLAVPELLVDPAREEGSDLRVVGRAGGEQVAGMSSQARSERSSRFEARR